MREIKRVLVGWGSPEDDAELLRYAGVVARLHPGAELNFLHVTRERDDARRARGELLAAVSAELGPPASGRPYICEAGYGDRVDLLLRRAVDHGADVILLGHGSGRLQRSSLARRLAALAPGSLWLVPRRAPARVRRVMAAVDFSQPSAVAAGCAARIAVRAGAEVLVLLHVREKSSRSSMAATRRNLDAWMDSIPKLGGTPRVCVEQGDPVAAEILRAARRLEIDLIVVGARGANPASAVLLGAEAEQTMRESTVSVLVAREREIIPRVASWAIEGVATTLVGA